ncbi:MAG: DUF1614 domain-containing protein [Euryarchaeota archaeon]|nr:DUF1614 domain-containing protein [Euryarchaeota archaeon]
MEPLTREAPRWLPRMRFGQRTWYLVTPQEPREFLFLLLLLVPVAVVALEAPLGALPLPPVLLAGLLLAMLFGGSVEVPVFHGLRSRKPTYSTAELDILEELYHVDIRAGLATGGERVYRSKVALNLGGFGAPVVLAALILWMGPGAAFHFQAVALMLLVALATHLLAEIRPGIGFLASPALGILPIPLALLLSDRAGLLGLAAGAPGILIGLAALLVSTNREKNGAPVFSLGGAGVFPAIFLSQMLAALLVFLGR